MKRKGFLINATVLLLLIPLILLAVTYEDVSSYITYSQSQGVLLTKSSFTVVSVQNDLQNVVDMSLRRAYLTLTEYVIHNGLLTDQNASAALKSLVLNGTIKGVPQASMTNITLDNWFVNLAEYLRSQGMEIEPSNVSEFEKHVQITVAPLTSFEIVGRVRLVNVTISDLSGTVIYSGDIPASGYVYSVVSVVGFEDPLLPASLNGLYTRVIHSCSIPYPGPLYGYYNTSNVTELTLGWCYLGVNATASYGSQTVYYPTVLNRFEDLPYDRYVLRQKRYVEMAEELQGELGIEEPIGLITFLVPGSDPTLLGALTSLNLGAANDSVAFYFLNCVRGKGEFCLEGTTVNDEYPSFKLDNVTKILVFNSTG